VLLMPISGGAIMLHQERRDSDTIDHARCPSVELDRANLKAPTPRSSQRNTSGRAGWKQLGRVVTMRSRSLGRMLVMSRIRHAAIVP
jgi:hypothetical protein